MTALNLYTECEDPEDIIEGFKKFAEYHVQKALKEASENAYVDVIDYNNYEVDKKSILNAYPLENIK